MAKAGEPPKDELTPDQRRFVDEYLVDLNGVQAYRRAYPGASYNTARSQAAVLLHEPSIRREIDAARADARRRLRVGMTQVTREVAAIAFSDVLGFFRPDGTLRPLREVPVELRRAVAAVKVRREKVTRRKSGRATVTEAVDVVEYKLWSKPDALEKLCKRLGLTEKLPPLDAFLLELPEGLRREMLKAIEFYEKERAARPGSGVRERVIDEDDPGDGTGRPE